MNPVHLGRRPLVAACLLSLLAAPALAQGPAPAARLDAALAEYEVGHYAQAYALLVPLADRGHSEAARIAVQMWRHGRALYGLEFSASARQVESWTQAWGCGDDSTRAACKVAQQTP